MTQLQLFELDLAEARALAGRVNRDRWRPLDGPTRLFLGLLRSTDLDETAIVAAAALCLELDLLVLERNGAAAA